MLKENGGRLTLDICHDYIDKHVFKLSSSEFLKEHPEWPGYVGLEIEMFPVSMNTEREFPPALSRKDSQISEVLAELGREQGWTLSYEDVGSEKLLLVLRISSGETITFEPGGQIEFSSQPYLCLDKAHTRLLDVQALIEKTLRRVNVSLLQVGIDPWHTLDEIGIQTPKKRYLAMNDYFSKIHSQTGPRMMRQSCSIQVCLDFGHDDSFMVKRYLAAQLLAPIGAAIFANSPYSEGRYHEQILSHRTSIWRSLDAKRTGFVGLKALHKDLSRANCVKSYLDFALSCPIVFIEDLGYLVPTKPISMKEWMTQGIQGRFPSLHDFETHVSLLFPEVRPRGYMELRSVDCQPRPWQIVPAAFYVGLLYDHKNLEKTLEILLPSIGTLEERMNLAVNGLHSPALHKDATHLMQMAMEGMGRMNRDYCDEGSVKKLKVFFHHFTERGRTPADDLVDFMKGVGRSCPTLADFRSLEDKWHKKIA